MESCSVNYLMSGDAHAPYLVASLLSVRRGGYDGQIMVHAYPESMETVQAIARDARLDIVASLWDPFYRGKNGQFINKIRLMQTLACKQAMYLDADTIVRCNLRLGFLEAVDHSFTGTQFCDWVSNTGTIKNRVSRLFDIPVVDPANVKSVLGHPYPSVNGGVFFCRPDSGILPLWERWSYAARDIFICDETVLHAVMGRYYGNGFFVLSGGAWNCSPKYRPTNLKEADVKIWHGHGDSFVRSNKCKFGVNLWYPAYVECLEQNYGNILEWSHKVNNRFLTALIEEKSVST